MSMRTKQKSSKSETPVQKMRRFDWIMVTATAIIAVATVWNVIVVQRQLAITTRALTGVERPILYARILNYDILKSATVTKDMTPYFPTVDITIENIGRQPAVIDQIFFGVRSGNADNDLVAPDKIINDLNNTDAIDSMHLSDVLFRGHCEEPSDGQILPVGAKLTIKCFVADSMTGTFRWTSAAAILTGGTKIFVQGIVNYHSTLGTKWRDTFGMKFIPPFPDSTNDLGHFDVIADPTITYDRLLSDN